MTNADERDCVVTVDTTDGTATAGADYTAISGLTFPVTMATQDLSIETLQDLLPEPSETFTVSLTLDPSSDEGCELADAEATITIIDDDDGTPPSVTIDQAAGQADPTATSPILFTAVFSEPVTGFTGSDVMLSGTAGATTAAVTGGPSTYTVAVSGMTAAGTVIASIPANAANDLSPSANPSLASTSTDNTVTYVADFVAPTVTINQAGGQADPTTTSPILFTVLFSEPVTGFATGDVTLGGTAGATTAVVSGSGAMYTVSVSGMTTSGTVIATIAAGVANDLSANANANLASTSTDNTVTYVVEDPEPLTIEVPADITQPNDPGEAGAIVEFAPATASGGTGAVQVECDRLSGSFFPLGTTIVTCTATDGNSATATDTFQLTGARDAAVLADPPEVDREEDDRDERDEQHVQHVPAQQGLGTDLERRRAGRTDLVTEDRGVAHHVGADGDGPQRQLVPGQQVAGERQQASAAAG
jgi:hypothetical protein